MNSVLAKLREFVSFDEPEAYDEYEDDLDRDETEGIAADAGGREERQRRYRPGVGAARSGSVAAGSNVIGMPGTSNGAFEVMVFEPRSFEKMPQVIQALRERKSVVLNLTMMEPDEAQRAVDFVAGGTYAMDGHQERVGESIFLFTPNSVKVTTHSGAVHETPSSSQSESVQPGAWATDPESLAQ
ncbi:MAG: cell division protein SepF [Cyanobacteria bacterium QS_8_64_29]|nr:MAG: cell division protein SepF [Cyanobacteria bacterium QS_8_64_29]